MKINILKKVLAIMKFGIYGFLLQCTFFTLLTASNGLAQQQSIYDVYLTIQINDGKIIDAFETIEKKTGFKFTYNDAVVKENSIIRLNVVSKSLGEILGELSKMTNLKFKRINQNIHVSERKNFENSVIEVELQQGITITGRVTSSEDNGGIPGVNVILKGTTQGTVTDVDGNYSLEVPGEESVIVFSSVGYQQEEVTVGNLISIDIILSPDITALEEIVVVGYGTQKKVNVTGAVDVISNDQIKSRQLPTVTQLLQGQVPGLTVSVGQSGFQPGATLQLNIRGMGSINGGSPYVVIDGIPGDMNRLNPEDIESISVLKDAAASAIYGARAPYGVILITTKSGRKNQKMTATYNGSVSINTPQRLPQGLDSYTHARVLNEAASNLGGGHRFDDKTIDNMIAFQNEDWDFIRESLQLRDEIDPRYGTFPKSNGNGKWEHAFQSYANNDWYDIIYGESVSQKHDISFRGGSEKTSYYLSAGYLGQNGVFNFGDDSFQRVNLTAKINTAITDWWDVRYETRFMKSDRYFPNGNLVFGSNNSYVQLFHYVSRTFPSAPLYTGYGNQYEAISVRLLEDGGNDRITTTENWQIMATELRPAKGWKINGDFAYMGLDKLHNNPNTTYWYESSVDRSKQIPGYKTVPNSLKTVHYSNFYWTSNVLTSYEHSLNNKHNFFVMVGAQFEYGKNNSLSAYKTNMIVQDIPSLQTATGEAIVQEALSHASTQGYFGRFSYNYDEKYLFESNVRADGTSRFQEGNRWGTFPSFALGWVISNEKFWDPVSRYINYLKLRGSWGSLGNQNVPPYLDMALIPLNTGTLNWLFDYGSTKPVGYAGTPSLVSPGLTWETATTLNVGTNMAFFEHRLQFDFDWFERTTTNMIGPAESLPGVLGASTPKSNNATLRTRGWEAVLKWKQILSNDLSYFINLNFYDSRSVVTEYTNPTKYLGGWYEGAEAGDIWGYTSNGLFKSQEEVDAHLNEVDQSFIFKTWRPGDLKYEDLNDDGKVDNGMNTLDDHGDLSIIGNSMPHFQFGFSAGVNFKGFDLSMLLTGTARRQLYYHAWSTAYWGFQVAAQSDLFTKNLDYFRDSPGDKYSGLYMGDDNINLDAHWPKPYLNAKENGKNRQKTSLYLADASYVRLQNVQLGYNLPQKFISKIKLAKVRVYFSGENLLTFTKLPDGIDPVAAYGYANQAGKTYGPDRMYSFGLTVTY